MRITDLPVKQMTAIRAKLISDNAPADFGPNTLVLTLPPSVRPSGSKLRADVYSPTSAIQQMGCSGTGCASGSNIILGAKIEVKIPVKKLVLNKAAGTAGYKFSISKGAFTVNDKPNAYKIEEATKVTIGPDDATSKRSSLFFGKLRRGVIDPKVPICSDGIGIGKPILTFLNLAITKCPISWRN